MDRDKAIKEVKACGVVGLQAVLNLIDVFVEDERRGLEQADEANDMFRAQGRIASLKKLRSTIDAVRKM